MQTRRKFLGTTVTAAALGVFMIRSGGLEQVLANIPQQSDTQHSRITFEQAVADVNLRQAYIDQIVREELGASALKHANFIYDAHLNAAARELEYINFEVIKHPKYKQRILNDLNNPNFLFSISEFINRFPQDMSLEDIKGELRRDEVLEDLTDFMISKLNEKFDAEKEYIPATTPLLKYGIGDGLISNVYLSHSFFETVPYEVSRFDFRIGKKRIKLGKIKGTFKPVEEWLKASIRHEYVHARDQYSGFTVAGTHIDHKSLGEIDKIYGFVFESRAYLHMFSYLSRFNNPGHRAYATYLGAAYLINELIEEWKGIGEWKDLSKTERRIYDNQMRQLIAVKPLLEDASDNLRKFTKQDKM